MQLISSMILLLYAKRSNFQCLIYIVFQLVSFKAIAFRNNVRKTLFPVLAGFVADSLSIAGLFIGSIHFTPSVSLTLSLSLFSDSPSCRAYFWMKFVNDEKKEPNDGVGGSQIQTGTLFDRTVPWVNFGLNVQSSYSFWTDHWDFSVWNIFVLPSCMIINSFRKSNPL